MQRKVSDIVLWLFILFYSIIINKSLLGGELISLHNFFYSVIMVGYLILLTSIINYFLRRFLNYKKWFVLPLFFISIYIVSVYVTLSALTVLADIFSDIESLQYQRKIFKLNNFQDIFTYHSLLWVLSVLGINSLLPVMVFYIRDYHVSKAEGLRLREEKREIEMSFLRSQIQPHFLFNTLNNIYGLVMENKEAATLILKLSDLLRFSLYESSNDKISLKREVAFIEDYLTLEKYRHPVDQAVIRFEKKVTNEELLIEPLILINFIENALKHGLNNSIHKNFVHIVLEQSAGIIDFSVTNSYQKKTKTSAKGIGLTNVKKRLDLVYPGYHDLKIKDTGEMYNVKLIIKVKL